MLTNRPFDNPLSDSLRKKTIIYIKVLSLPSPFPNSKGSIKVEENKEVMGIGA